MRRRIKIKEGKIQGGQEIMKTGTKQVVLFIFAISLIFIGYKHAEILSFFKGEPTLDSSGNIQSSGNNTPMPPESTGDKSASASAALHFSNSRLERDVARSRAKEALEGITKDSVATAEIKNSAYEKIIQMTEFSVSETKIESLVREKGFSDAYACFNEIGEIDVLVKTDSLSEEQVAQIADIILRHSNLDYKDIHIRKVA